MYPAEHGVDGALERLEPLACDLWTWRELQPPICERRSKPLLPDVDAFFRFANTGAPVCDGMSVCTSQRRLIGVVTLTRSDLDILGRSFGSR